LGQYSSVKEKREKEKDEFKPLPANPFPFSQTTTNMKSAYPNRIERGVLETFVRGFIDCFVISVPMIK
jgi:hypothetical protein